MEDKKIVNIEETSIDECKSCLHEIIETTDNKEILLDIFVFATRKIRNQIENENSEVNYCDMIIDILNNITDDRVLRYFYIFISEKTKRVL